jgi:hypothetical protein
VLPRNAMLHRVKVAQIDQIGLSAHTGFAAQDSGPVESQRQHIPGWQKLQDGTGSRDKMILSRTVSR